MAQNTNNNNILSVLENFTLDNSDDIAREVAENFRKRRVEKNITRIIRKTKCSGFPKRNVPLPKTKRTFFSPLISDRHNPFQGCGGSVFMRL